jgi:hypothetical protein
LQFVDPFDYQSQVSNLAKSNSSTFLFLAQGNNGPARFGAAVPGVPRDLLPVAGGAHLAGPAAHLGRVAVQTQPQQTRPPVRDLPAARLLVGGHQQETGEEAHQGGEESGRIDKDDGEGWTLGGQVHAPQQERQKGTV